MWDEAWTPPLKDGATLSPWQKLGVAFLNRLRESFKCGLLGDDMGIEKVSVPNMRFYGYAKYSRRSKHYALCGVSFKQRKPDEHAEKSEKIYATSYISRDCGFRILYMS